MILLTEDLEYQDDGKLYNTSYSNDAAGLYDSMKVLGINNLISQRYTQLGFNLSFFGLWFAKRGLE